MQQELYFLLGEMLLKRTCISFGEAYRKLRGLFKLDKTQTNKNKRKKNLAAIMLVVYDIFAVSVAYFLALWFRFDCKYSLVESSGYLDKYLKFIPIYAVFCVAVFFVMKLYQSLWQFASFNEFSRILIASIITAAGHCVGITLIFAQMPLSYYIFGAIIQLALLFIARFGYRFILLQRKNAQKNLRISYASRVMLIGAGVAGQMILQDIKRASEIKDVVYCIIDDDSSKWGKYLDGVPIIGGRDDILAGVEKYKIQKIYLAIPSCTPEEKRDILNICKDTNCELKNLPGLYQLVNGDISVSSMKDVAVEDLLGRAPISVEMSDIFRQLSGKVILVTGGGGSIGSELCRQIATHAPKQLIIFDVYENNAYDIEQELKEKCHGLNLVVLIGSVRDSRKLNQVFETYNPEIVFHAAAHKHVPLMETSPCEAIKNNAIGTYKTAYAAMMNGCKRFVLISTDKAVNPTNIMGASKRLCEMIIQSFDKLIKEGRVGDLPVIQAHVEDEDGDFNNSKHQRKDVDTEFVAVRFGNVLGSNGSVIPLFKKQIANGGPVKVTHPDIIRYFMTIPEAVSLVLQAETYAKGGEIFVLDMGSPMKIDTLAKNLIKLSGYTPNVDIKIEYTGLRPGEKLFEEKLMAEEGITSTPNKLIHIGKPIEFDSDKFLQQLKFLMKACFENRDEDVREMVMKIVTTYKPADNSKSGIHTGTDN